MGTIITGLQTRWRDCFATSEKVRLTLGTNGEQTPFILTPQKSYVEAGFAAPTAAPTGVVAAGGTLSGYYVYAYCYASTQYPYVENAVTTGNGELWPRSNPSPFSAVQNASAGSRQITVTLTKTTRSDVDKIVVYRTIGHATSGEAQAAADAGLLYFITSLINNDLAGLTAFVDSGLTDTGEQLELDNYTPDTAQFCAFDGIYWWMVGSFPLEVDVTLNGTATITISGEQWFDGRNGQLIHFKDISTGGSDGVGGYYLKVTSRTTGETYADQALTIASPVAFTGSTTGTVQGVTNVLYRSKPYNPFSWGFTEDVQVGDVLVPTPQSFALNLGGGNACAMAVTGNGNYLKIDFDSPQKAIVYDLSQAAESGFGSTATIVDATGSVTSHFTQFNGFLNGNPVLIGLDAYNGRIVAYTGGSNQVQINNSLGNFLRQIDRSDEVIRFYHGGYDPGTELNYFYVRLYDTEERLNIVVWIHGSNGQCGWMPDYDVLCSCPVLDIATGQKMTFGGTELGLYGWLFASPYTVTVNDTEVNRVSNWMFWKNSVLLYQTAFPALTINGVDDLKVPVILMVAASGYIVTGEAPWSIGQTLLFIPNAGFSFSARQTAIVASILPGNYIDQTFSPVTVTGSNTGLITNISSTASLSVGQRVRIQSINSVQPQDTNIAAIISSTSILVGVSFALNDTAATMSSFVVRYQTTFTVPFTDPGAFSVMFDPSYYTRAWHVLTNQQQPVTGDVTRMTDFWFLKLASWTNMTGDTMVFTLDYYNHIGSDELMTDIPPWAAGGTDYILIGYYGGIPMASRCYFDLEVPASDKKLLEAWITLEVEDSDVDYQRLNPAIRFYQYYTEESFYQASTLRLKTTETETIATTDCNVYNNKTSIPSLLLKSVGIEFIHADFAPFMFYNYTVKANVIDN